MMVSSILSANHRLLSLSMISTHTIWRCLSGSKFFGVHCILVSYRYPVRIFLLKIFLYHPFFLVSTTSTHNSSLSSLFMAFSGVSHISTFPPGDTYLLNFFTNNCSNLPFSSMIFVLTNTAVPSHVVTVFLFNHSLCISDGNNGKLIVIAGSCLSLYPSLTSEFDNVVAQLGHIRWTLNPLYKRF